MKNSNPAAQITDKAVWPGEGARVFDVPLSRLHSAELASRESAAPGLGYADSA